MNEYLNVIRNHYTDFRGRARRREYWMFTLINAVIILLLQLPSLIAGTDSPSGFALFSVIVLGLYALVILLPSLAVSVRRLHDTGRSGWWLLLTLIPLLGDIVLLIFVVMDSQPGPNRWGPNPRGLESTGAGAW